ncbi:MAG: exopolyphosphatase [Acidobacteria bacterium]|nr:MAG: exopolyphosphatase [Acidobacteriota bacterium]
MYKEKNKQQLFAALDLGSNSFHLVIARKTKNRLVFLDRVKIMVRLADGLGKDGSLSLAAQERACEAFEFFEERLRGFPPESVRIVGTNTLRAATNSSEVIAKLEKILGHPIFIINGREEARLVYLGVTGDLPPIYDGRFVVDIGGGSTELIWGSGKKPKKMVSLDMGCVSYSKRFFPKGKITAKHYKKALLAAELELTPVEGRFNDRYPAEALGSSGTIKTIEAVVDGMGVLKDGITLKNIEILSEAMIEAGHVKRLSFDGLKDIRKPVFPGGVAVLHAVLKRISLPPLHASRSALREGVLYEMIGRLNNRDQREITVKQLMQQYAADPHQAELVEKLSLDFFSLLKGKKTYPDDQARRYLRWASSLHEIGLSISHSGYHRHGSYLVENSDLAGFTRHNKKVLSFLILNHRRKIRIPKNSDFRIPWTLLFVLRLACLFLRSRKKTSIPPVELKYLSRKLTVKIDSSWLEEHPLTAAQLEQERAMWRSVDREFDILSQ